jgi:hypothetical protein
MVASVLSPLTLHHQCEHARLTNARQSAVASSLQQGRRRQTSRPARRRLSASIATWRPRAVPIVPFADTLTATTISQPCRARHRSHGRDLRRPAKGAPEKLLRAAGSAITAAGNSGPSIRPSTVKMLVLWASRAVKRERGWLFTPFRIAFPVNFHGTRPRSRCRRSRPVCGFLAAWSYAVVAQQT